VLLPDGLLVCSCGTQERQGLCCCKTIAVIQKYFPDWEGSSQYDICPRWWIYWLNFGHHLGCGQFTSDTKELLSREKAGPSLPSPIPDELYEAPITRLHARERVRNYSLEMLRRLVPTRVVHSDAHGIGTTEVVDGLTQDSFIAHDSSRFDGDPSNDFHDEEEEDNLSDNLSVQNQPFSESLQVPLPKNWVVPGTVSNHIWKSFLHVLIDSATVLRYKIWKN
jgi:hypothetical protein